MLRSLLLVLLSQWLHSLAAILPSTSTGIASLCSNANCVTRHTFSVTLGASVKSDAKIVVEFPLEYSTTNLGISTCVGFKVVSGVRSAVPCAVDGRMVTWTFDSLSAGSLDFGLNGVTNPGLSGTTGYFKIWTYMSAYVIEANEVFATVGITSEPASFTSSSLLTTSAVINTSQLYEIKVKTSAPVLASSWFRVNFPAGFNLDSGLSCSVTVQTQKLTSACSASEPGSTWVNFAGLTIAIPAATDVTLSISGVKNPSATGYAGFITAQLLQVGGYNIQQISSFLQSPEVLPGLLSNVVIEGTPLNQGQEIWYTITATVANPIPKGGYFKVIFPPEFGGVTNCMVNSGFVSLTDTGVVTCNTKRDVNAVWFSDFLDIAPGTVSVRVKALNPSIATCSNFQLQSMLSNGNFIDINSAAGTLKFVAAAIPSTMNIDLLTSRVLSSRQEAGPLELYVECKALLPATPLPEAQSAIAGEIIVTLPNTVQILDETNTDVKATLATLVPPAKLSCLFGKNKDRAMKCDWDSTLKQIVIDTPSNLGLESCPLSITVAVIGKNEAAMGFNFPDPGSQTIKIQTYIKAVGSSLLVLKEEANFKIPIPPKEFKSATGVTAAGSITVTYLHANSNLPNYLKVAIKPSIAIPSGHILEFEFSGFQADLGSGLTTSQKGPYSCFYDAAWAPFSTCEVEVGPATGSSFVRMTSNSGTLAASENSVYFPQLTNGASGTPSITVRSKTLNNEAIEYQVFTLPALTAAPTNPTVAAPTITSPVGVQSTNEELTFSIALASSLAATDMVFIRFANHHFDVTAAPTAFTTTACSATLPDYKQFNSNPVLAYLYTEPTGGTAGPLAPCIKIPETQYHSGTITVTILVGKTTASAFTLVQSHTVTLTVNPDTMANTAITEEFYDTAEHLLNQPNALYKFVFDTVDDVNVGGSVSVLFPASSFASVDPCFDLVNFPAETVCSAEQNYSYKSATYHRVVISGWTTTFSVKTAVNVYVSATSKGTGGLANLEVVSNADDQGTGKIINSATFPLTLGSISTPSVASVNPFLTPKISLRNNEFGPLVFTITPTVELPATVSATVYSFVKVTRPTVGIPNMYDMSTATSGLSFAQAAGSWLECKFNDVLAAKCVIDVDDVIAYTPTSLSLSVGTAFTLSLSTQDATTATEIGFKAPATVGYYQFKVGTYVGSPGAIKEEAAPWVYIGPGRFTNVKVTSYNKGAGQFSALNFHFKASTAVAASSLGGVVIIKFPFDTAGNGMGWKEDLGMGLPNNAPIDCIAGTSTVANTQFSCTLVWSKVDAPKIKVSNFSAVSPGGLFDFTIIGIQNPTAANYDLAVEIGSFEYSTATASNPVYTPKDWTFVTHFDTTLATSNPTTATDSAVTNVVSNLAYGNAAATFKMDLPDLSYSGTEKVLVKIPLDFTLASTLGTCTYFATVTCMSFPVTGWVLVSFGGAPSGSLTQLEIGPVTNPSYAPPISVKLYVLKDRKNTNIITINLPSSLTKGTLIVTNNIATLSKISGRTEMYCFKIEMGTKVPAKGSVLITFPSGFTSIDANSCILSEGTSKENKNLNVACVGSGTTIRVSGFSSDIIANNFVEPCFFVTNPTAGTYDPIKCATFKSTDNTYPVDEWTDAASTVITAPSPAAMTTFTAGIQYKPSVQATYVAAGVNIAPLILKVTTGTQLTKNAGFVKVIFSLDIDLPTNGQLRCIWADNSSEYISDSCSLDAAADTLTITAPKTIDIVGTTTYTVTITSVNADKENGLLWGAAGDCTLKIEISSDGSTMYGYTRAVVNIGPVPLTKLEVSWDHENSDLWNRFTIQLDNAAVDVPTFASGGRLVVEFPNFYDTFGYVVNHSPVSCVITGLTPLAAGSPPISCYLEVGDSTPGTYPAVVVTGFDTVSSSATGITLDFDSLKNPNVSGDDKIVWIQVSAVDVSAGWPGVVLSRKRIDNLFALKTAVTGSELSVSQLVVETQTDVGASSAKYTFGMKKPSSVNILEDDIYYIVFKEADVSHSGNFGTLPAEVKSASYYPFFHFIILRMLHSTTDISFKLDGFTNPSYQADDMYYFGYHIQNHQVVATYKSATGISGLAAIVTPSAGMGVSRSDSLVTFYANDILDWRFKITLAKKLPKNGAIVITLTSSSFQESFCYSDSTGDSSLIGTYSCTITGQVATLIPTSDDQPPTTAIIITANVKNGTANDSVTIYTKFNNLKTGYWIEKPASITVTVDAASAPAFHEIPVPMHFFKRSVRVGAAGAFTFKVNVKTQLTMNVGLIEVTLPNFTVAAGGTLQCTWALPSPLLSADCSSSTSGINLTVVVKAPKTANIPSGAVDVVISTINADDPEGQGLVFPATDAKDYDISITVKSDGTTVSQIATEPFTLMNASLNSLSVSYGHRGNGQLNYFTFSFKAGADVTSGKIRFVFPTKDEYGNALFDPDLGLGVACSSTVPCHTTGLTGATCTLNCGMAHVDRPASIDVTFTAALDISTTTYTASFDGIKNPASAGTDDRLLYFRVLIYDSTSKIITSSTNYFVMSVLTNGAPDTVATGGVAVFTGNPFSATATLDITPPSSVTQDGTSKLILIVPFALSATDVVNNGASAYTLGEVHPETKWIIMPNSSGTTPKLVFAGGSLAALYVGANVRLLHIKGDVLAGDYSISCTSTGDFKAGGALTAAPVFPSSAGKMNNSQLSEIVVSYALGNSVPADGCIVIEFAGATTSIDNSLCMASHAASPSFGGSWECTIAASASPKTLTFNKLGALTATDNIKVVTRAKFSGADIGGIALKTYANSACTYMIEKDNGDAAATPTIAQEGAVAAHPIIYFKPPTVVSRLAIKNKTADLVFNFTPRTNLQAASSGHLKFSASTAFAVVSPQAYPSCTITTGTTKIPAPCALAGSDLNIYPGVDLASGTSYRIELTTQGEALGANGFKQPATNAFQDVTLQTYTSADETSPADKGILRFATPNAAFTSLKITRAHESKGYMNIFKFEIASIVIANTDSLIVEFPTSTEDGLIALFSDDLGLGLATGSSIAVDVVGYTTAPSCIFKKGSNASKASAVIKCTGGALSAPGTITLKIPAVNPNPSNADADKAISNFRVRIENSNRLVLAEQWVINAFAVDVTSPSSTSAPVAAWNPGTPNVGGTTAIDVPIASHTEVILIGTGIDLTVASVSETLNYKNSALNIVHITGLSTSPVSLAGLTAPASTVTVKVNALAVKANSDGKMLVDEAKETALPATTAVTATLNAITCTVSNGGGVTGINELGWMLQDFSISVTANIPATTHIIFEVVGTLGGTFADVDSGFFRFVSGFASEGIDWKYVESTGVKKFEIYSFSQLSTGTDFIVQVYAKIASGTSKNTFKAVVYSSSSLTDVWGEGTSATFSATTTTQALSLPITITATGGFKASSNILGIVLSFTPGIGITAGVNSGVYLDLSNTILGCTGSPTLAVSYSTSSTVTSFSSYIAYGQVPSNLIASTLVTVTYTFSTSYCAPSAAGYQDLNVSTKEGGTLKETGYGRIFILPQSTPTTFTMETYVNNQNSWTMVHTTFQPSTALSVGDVLVFSFPVVQSSGGFAIDLGLTADSGLLIPFTSTPANIDTCWLTKGSSTTGLVADAKINCEIKTSTTGILDILFAKIKTPITGGSTATFSVYVYSANSYSQAGSAPNAAVFATTGTCSQTGTAAATPAPSTYYSSSTYTISFTLSGSLSAATGDYLMVELGSAYDVSALTIGGVVESKIDSPAPCPCVLVKLAAAATAPSFTLAGLKNPAPAATSTFNVYPNLKSTRQCANAPSITVALTSYAFTAPSVTNMGPASTTFNPNQDYPLVVSFTTPTKIPTTASIVLKFPTASFETIQFFHAETTLTTSSSFTYAISNTDELAISGFNEVASGTTVSFSYISAPLKPTAAAGSVAITMSAVVSTTTLASVTQTITVTALSYLRSSQFSSRFPSLFGHDYSDPNGITSNVLLVLHFKTTAAMAPGESVVISAAGDIFKASTGSSLFALFTSTSRLFAHSVSRVYTTTTEVTIKAPASAGLAVDTEYDVIISANNNDADGISLQATGINDVDVSTTETGVTHVSSGLSIPGASVFSEFFVQPFTLNQGQTKPYLIHFRTPTAITSANGQIVVQFPVDTQFDANPFTATAQGGKINCVLKAGAAMASLSAATPVCRAFAGEAGSSYRNPATIIIGGIAASANHFVEIVISSIAIPATAGRVADITVFTQEMTADVPTVNHYMTYRNALISQAAAAAASSQPWTSVTKPSSVVAASTDYTISLSRATFDIDTILVVFPSMYSIKTTTAVSVPASTNFFVIPETGQVLILLSARSDKSATSFSITITGVGNVSYIPANAADAAITVYTSAYRQFIMTTIPFSSSIPTTAIWTEESATMVSSLTDSSVPNTESSVIVGLFSNYAIVIKFPNSDIPKDGVVLLEFPAEFQSVGDLVYATVTGGVLKCSKETGLKAWNCPATIAITKDTNITLYGRAQNPSTAATSSNFKISAYVDSGKTKIIAKNFSAGTVTTVAGTKVSIPDDFYAPHQVVLQEIPIKAGEKDTLTWTFKSNSSFDTGTGAVIITPEATTTFTYDSSAQFVAIFYDMSVTQPVGYMASSCSVDSTSKVLTITPPKTKVIDSNKLWKLIVHTSNSLHPQYPANTVAKYSWAVELKYTAASSEKFKEEVFNIKAKPAVCKLNPVVAHVNQENSVYVLTLGANIAASTDAYVSLIFPLSVGGSPAFDHYLGQTTNLGGDLGCSSSGLSGTLECIVDPSAYTYSVRNTVQIDIDGISAPYTTPSSAISIYFTGIKNPATVDKIQWFAVRVGAASDFVEHYSKLQAVFQTTAAPTITATHAASFIPKLSDAKVDATGASTTGFSLGVALAQGDYVVLVFPHTIAAASAVTTYGLATIASVKTILCKATTTLTSTANFDMTGLALPSFAQSAVLKAYVYSKQALAFEVWYDTGTTSYTPHTTTVVGITTPTAAAAYFNVKAPYLIEFKLDSTIATKASFKVIFPAGFALASVCRVTSWVTTLTTTNPGSQSCAISGSNALIDFGAVQYTADVSVKVLVYATPGTAFTSPLTVTVESYIDSSTMSQKNGSGSSGGSLAVTANPANIVVTADPYVMTNRMSIMRAGDFGALTFKVKSTVTLTKNTGLLDVTLKTTLTAVTLAGAGAYRCVWIDSSMIKYLAASCSFTVNASGDVLSIKAPASTDIPLASTWVVQANTIMQATNGFQFASTTPVPGFYEVTAQTKGDGSTAGDAGAASILLAPAIATAAQMISFSNSAGMPTALQLTINPSVTIPLGSEDAAGSGTSHTLISFDVDVMGPNLGSPTVSLVDQTDGIGVTDCASVATFGPTTKCYIRRGDSVTKRTTDVIVNKYASITTTSTGKLLLAPIFNPAAGKIVHVKVAVRNYNSGTQGFDYVQYQEFNYLYMTSDGPSADSTGTATYGSSALQGASTTLEFTTAASPMPSDSNTGLALFILSESQPKLAGISITTHTIYILPNNKALAIIPVGGAFASPISLTAVPLPLYATSQTWSGYFMVNHATVTYYTYPATSCSVVTLPTANIIVNQVEGLAVGGPFIKRTNQFSLRIKPQLKIPEGGEIRISFGAALGDAGSSCTIDGGLQGPYQCAYAGSQVIRITGFTEYDGKTATTPAILVAFTTKTTVVAASASMNFSVTTYGTSGTGALTSTIESGSTPKTLEVKTAADVLTLRLMPMIQGQARACLGQYTDLSFNIKPRAAPYAYKYQIAVQFHQTANLPAGSTVLCHFSNGVNTVPAEECTPSFASSKLTVTAIVPEQIALTTANQYTLTFSMRDSGALNTDGFKLPTAAEVGVLPNPGKPYFYLVAFDTDGTTKKEAQKMIQYTCGEALTTFAFKLGTTKIASDTYLDLSFKVANEVPTTGEVIIEFPTNNGVANVFPIDLGVGATTPTDISCDVVSGTASWASPKCTVYPASAAGPSTPATIKISSLNVALLTTDTQRILIGKVRTPTLATDSIFSMPLISRIRVYTKISPFIKSFSANEATVRYPAAFSTATTNTSTGTVTTTATTTAQDGKTVSFTFATAISSVGAINDVLVMNVGPSFVLPSSITCGGLPSGLSCAYMKITGLGWLIATITASTASVETLTAVLRSPEWYLAAGYQIQVMAYTAGGDWCETSTGTLAALTPTTGNLVSVDPNSNHNLNTYDIYTITITPVAQSVQLKRVQIKFPAEYQWVDATCKAISGIQDISATNPISCVSDCITNVCTNTVTITNFKDATATDNIVVKIGAMSPAVKPAVGGVSGKTNPFEIRLFGLATGTDGTIEMKSDLAQTITDVDFPFLAWVDPVKTVKYDRWVKAGSSGDIYVRMEPKNPVPAGTGSIQLQLPTGFAPVSGSTPVCLLEHGMLYYNTDKIWTGRSDSMVTAPCIWTASSNTVTVTFPAARPKEWNGFGKRCSLLIVTSVTAAMTMPGFTAPNDPGYYTAKVTTYSGTSVLESSSPSVYVNPPELDRSAAGATYTITSLTNSGGAENVFKIKFTTPRDAPVGYLTFVKNVPQEVATIEVQLETFQSFAPDLGLGYKQGSSVPCTAMSAGLVPKNQLQCTFIPGDAALTTPLPARILVNSFEAIKATTVVELHLLRVKNPAYTTPACKPKIWVSMYKTAADGTVTGLAYPTLPYTRLVAVTNDLPGSSVASTANSLSLSPKTVDGSALLKIPLKLSVQMTTNDLIYLSFPGTWLTLPTTGLTVTIQNYATPATPVVAIAAPVVVVYPSASIITIGIPTATPALSLTINNDYEIDISGFINPPYLDSCTGDCPMWYYTIVNGAIKNVYPTASLTGNFWTDLGFTAGEVSGFSFTATSLKVDAANMKYDIKFSTVPRVAAGSTLQVSLPSDFPTLSSRTPAASCTTKLTGATCAIYGNGVAITGFAALKASSLVELTILGGKNPGAAGQITGFIVSASNSAGKAIINHTVSTSITIVAADAIPAYTFTLTPKSYTAGILTNYVLKASVASELPTGSIITLALPTSFSIPTDLKCTDLLGISSYRSCGVTNNNSITLVLNEGLASGANVSVTFTGIKNPLLTTTTVSQKFGPITLKAVYDGTTLSQSSSTAASAFLAITAPPTNITPFNFRLSPVNEAETGLYTMSIRAPVSMAAGENYAIRVLFPKSYTKTLVPAGTQLYCSSSPATQKCGVVEPNEVKFEVFSADIPANAQIDLTISGVANPVLGNTGQFSLQIVQQTDGSVVASTDSAGFFRILAAPSQAFFLSLSAEDMYAGGITSYNAVIDTNVTTLVKNGALWIDWPKQYQGLFLKSNYDCSVTGLTTVVSNCTWLKEMNYMRTQILIPALTASNQRQTGVTQKFTLKFFGISNPKTDGQTAPFAAKYADLDSNWIVSTTFENVGNNTITFKAGYQPISIPVIEKTVVQGTYSDLVTLDLGLSSYDPVRIMLSSDTTGLIFSPAELVLQYAWNTKTTFRVGATGSAKVGSYRVIFTKYESNTVQRFQPLSDLKVIVQASSANLPVTIGPILSASVGTTTLPITVSLASPTLYPLTVTLITGQSTNITVTPDVITFPAESQFANFTMTYSNLALSGSIAGQVLGAGKAAFQDMTNNASFTVIPSQAQPVSLLFSNVSAIGRVSAQAELRFSGLATVWFMYAPKGTRQPTANQLQTQTPVKGNSKQSFGLSLANTLMTNATENSTYYSALLDMNELKDNANYILYYAFQGADKVLSNVNQAEFKTLKSFKPAKFTVFTIIVTDPQQVLLAVCQALGIPCSLLLYIGSTAAANNTRLLQSDIPYEFVMTMDRGQEAASPQDQVALLDTPIKKNLLQQYLPTFSPTPSISSTISTYNYTEPTFVGAPEIYTITNSTVTINVTQNVAGQIFGVILERSGAQPEPAQIIQCLDGNNDPVAAEHCAVADTMGGTSAWLKFTNLEYFKRYRVWLAGTNNLPGFPAVTPDDGIGMLNLTAGKLLSTHIQETIFLTWADASTWLLLAFAGFYLV